MKKSMNRALSEPAEKEAPVLAGPQENQQYERDEWTGPGRFSRRFDRCPGCPFWRGSCGTCPWAGMWRRDPNWMPWGGGRWGGGNWGGSQWGVAFNGGRYRAPDCGGPDIGHIWFGLVDPIVCHGLMELERGQSPEHTLRECATMGVLVGMGSCPEQAIEEVEEWEHRRFRREPCPRG